MRYLGRDQLRNLSIGPFLTYVSMHDNCLHLGMNNRKLRGDDVLEMHAILIEHHMGCSKFSCDQKALDRFIGRCMRSSRVKMPRDMARVSCIQEQQALTITRSSLFD